jgi:hypothetical protein
VSLKIVISIATLTVAVVLSAFSIASVNDEVAGRILPIGNLCMTGDDCAAAPVLVASGPRTGEEVYNTCAACHSTGAAGAPNLVMLPLGHLVLLKELKPCIPILSKDLKACRLKACVAIALTMKLKQPLIT